MIKKNKRKKRKPKTSRQKAVKRLDDLARQIVRLRDEDTCQRCGKKVYGSDSQPSHVIPRRQSLFLRWDLLNLKVLCNPCHRWWHLNPLEAGAWFATKWPARTQYLMEHKQRPLATWYKRDFEVAENRLNEKLNDLKGE